MSERRRRLPYHPLRTEEEEAEYWAFIEKIEAFEKMRQQSTQPKPDPTPSVASANVASDLDSNMPMSTVNGGGRRRLPFHPLRTEEEEAEYWAFIEEVEAFKKRRDENGEPLHSLATSTASTRLPVTAPSAVTPQSSTPMPSFSSKKVKVVSSSSSSSAHGD